MRPIDVFDDLEHALHTKINGLQEHIRGSDIHDLRVVCRKLRAWLWLTEKSQNLGTELPLHNELKTWTDVLGNYRKWDVLCKECKKRNIPHDKIKNKRQRSCKKLQKSLDRDLRSFEHLLQQTRKKCSTFKINIKSTLRLLHQEQTALPTKLPNNKKKLHQLRIEIKRLHYRQSILQILSPSLQIENKQLSRLQKSLGELHDLEIFQKHFNKHISAQEILARHEKSRILYAKFIK